MDHLFACSCGEVLVKSSPGVTKIRNKILIFRDGNAYAICPNCNKENPVPVRLNDEEIATAAGQPRLFLRNVRK
jgi:hypothetical protein